MDRAVYSKQRRNELKKFIEQVKRDNACTRCGNSDWRVLEFHHRIPKEKKFSIFQAIHNRYSIKSVMKEMEKCDIVCANCHRIIHHEWNDESTNTDD